MSLCQGRERENDGTNDVIASILSNSSYLCNLQCIISNFMAAAGAHEMMISDAWAIEPFLTISGIKLSLQVASRVHWHSGNCWPSGCCAVGGTERLSVLFFLPPPGRFPAEGFKREGATSGFFCRSTRAICLEKAGRCHQRLHLTSPDTVDETLSKNPTTSFSLDCRGCWSLHIAWSQCWSSGRSLGSALLQGGR